jgi:cystathionine gamma-synthase
MEDSPHRAIAPPIVLSTTFERDEHGEYSGGFVYGRDDNPNRNALEVALAALEGGTDAAAFASGSAAAAAVFQALRPGDHVIAADDSYYSIRTMLREVFAEWHLEVTFADCTDLHALELAIRPATRLIFIETPSNPLMRITDVAAVSAIAHAAGAVVLCDNTLATPVFQRPLAHGADLVLQSTTKYISGHHDAMGGALITGAASELWTRIRSVQRLCGAVPSPFASWLTLRGSSTLVQRMRWHDESALAIARFLAEHAAVHEVLHPQLEAHPGYAVAQRQMSGTGGLFSFRVRGGKDAALAVAARVRLFRRATSFGGPESLIEHRASVEGPHSSTPEDLLRLAVGLEPTEELIADLAEAVGAG